MQNIKIMCDAQPFTSFFKVLQRFLQVSPNALDFSDFGSELVRIEHDASAANTGELLVRLYPSDALLCFAGAVFARDCNFLIIDETGHSAVPPITQDS